MAQGRLKQAELVSEVLKTDSALAETLAAARPVYYTKSGIVGMQLEQAIPETGLQLVNEAANRIGIKVRCHWPRNR
jgi:hypothetical protein